MEYALTKHFCAKLELITYGNGNHHNAAVSIPQSISIPASAATGATAATAATEVHVIEHEQQAASDVVLKSVISRRHTGSSAVQRQLQDPARFHRVKHYSPIHSPTVEASPTETMHTLESVSSIICKTDKDFTDAGVKLHYSSSTISAVAEDIAAATAAARGKSSGLNSLHPPYAAQTRAATSCSATAGSNCSSSIIGPIETIPVSFPSSRREDHLPAMLRTARTSSEQQQQKQVLSLTEAQERAELEKSRRQQELFFLAILSVILVSCVLKAIGIKLPL
jgi:hypothetical protein